MAKFEDAVRAYFGAPPEAEVYSEWEKGDNWGCDTCGYGSTPSSITLSAILRYRTPSGRLNPNKNQTWRAEFQDLPDVWAALFPEETKQ